MRNFGKYTEWLGAQNVTSKTFICWNCGKEIASGIGFNARYQGAGNNTYNNSLIYICHHCHAPNIQDICGNMIYTPLPGAVIKRLPEDIKQIYNEARSCISVGAYTAAVMLFRKILMNVAVNEGAEEGKTFQDYLQFLCKEKIIHKKQTKQAEKVKDLGNDANHKIECRTKDEAEMLFKFIEQFLKINYEFADEVENNDE